MRVPSSFGECLEGKSNETLYSLLHCLAHLHEEMADDTARLADHLDRTGQLVQRECDICGLNVTREVVYAMLHMTKAAIDRREKRQQLNKED